jgi:hypothetical protein
VKLGRHLGDTYPLIKVKDRLRCERTLVPVRVQQTRQARLKGHWALLIASDVFYRTAANSRSPAALVRSYTSTLLSDGALRVN